MDSAAARACWGWAILLGVWLLSARTDAQGNVPWVVIAATTSSESTRASSLLVTHALERELQHRGQTVLTAGAGSTVEQRHSAPAATIGPEGEQILRSALAAGRRELALERLAEARAALEPVDRLTDAELDQLRHTQARWMFEVCVMRAALLQEGSDTKRARTFMQGCVRSYPGFDAPTHPDILRLFEDARAQLSHGALEVLGPAGCIVRIFGIDVGRSPLRLDRVVAGPTPVQLECPGMAPSRRHIVQVTIGSTSIQIDPRFDETLRTEPDAVQLVYPNKHTRNANLAADSAKIAGLLGARALVLAAKETDSPRLVFSATATGMKRPALGELHVEPEVGADRDDVSRIVSALSTQDEPTRQPESPIALSPAEVGQPGRNAAIVAQADRAETTVEPPLGITLGVLGGAGLLASWVVYAERQHYRLQPKAERSDAVMAGFHRRGAWILSLGIVSAVSLVAAEFLLLPAATEGVPVAAWLVTTAGLITLAVGATYLFAGAQCEPLVVVPGSRVNLECYSWNADALFGPLLMISSIPLINVTLTYLVRRWLGGSTASLVVRGTGAAIDIRF